MPAYTVCMYVPRYQPIGSPINSWTRGGRHCIWIPMRIGIQKEKRSAEQYRSSRTKASPNACSLWERGQGQPATDFNPPNQLRRIKRIPKPLHMFYSSPDLVNRASHCGSWVAIRMSNSRESITSYCVQYVCRWIRRPGRVILTSIIHHTPNIASRLSPALVS
jgi:hypothetical protein